MNPRNPWSHAKERSYLTPEDIDAAIRAGGSKLGIYSAVLGAIQSGCAEDVRLCAFTALQGQAWKERVKP